jgi:hypothetical protein
LKRLSLAIEIAGAYCLTRALSYFLPSADTVLATEGRAPILYLRSFMDDKPYYTDMDGHWMSFDRSFEMKLARHFSLFGPFVGIDSPKDKVPKLGALRLIRSNDEWQREVASLMARSQAIVVAVGTTHWVKWEIGEIFSRKYAGKTLFLFPVTVRSLFFRKRQVLAEQARRIQALREAAPPGQQFRLAQKNEVLLACIATLDRNIAITCQYKRAMPNTHVLAAMIAHYFLMCDDGDIPAPVSTAADGAANTGSPFAVS